MDTLSPNQIFTPERKAEIAARTGVNPKILDNLQGKVWEKGKSPNPGGLPRKKGLKQLFKEIPETDVKLVLQQLSAKAKGGKVDAMALFLKHMPKGGESLSKEPIEVNVKLDNAEDIKKASELIINNMISGAITAGEASSMISILKEHGKILESVEKANK